MGARKNNTVSVPNSLGEQQNNFHIGSEATLASTPLMT